MIKPTLNLSSQSLEKQRMDAINDDAKQMEKIAHKRSLFVKKVRLFSSFRGLVHCGLFRPHISKVIVPQSICSLVNIHGVILSNQKEECTKKIRELGSLPADAFDKYQKTPIKAVSGVMKTLACPLITLCNPTIALQPSSCLSHACAASSDAANEWKRCRVNCPLLVNLALQKALSTEVHNATKTNEQNKDVLICLSTWVCSYKSG